jgi:hypothetical protein
MARRILRCSSQTSIAAMRGDLGWWRLQGRRDQRRLIFWGNLIRMADDRLTKKVYLHRRQEYDQNLSESSNWCHATHEILASLGLTEYWYDVSRFPNVEKWKKLISTRMSEREEKLWLQEIYSKRKLRTYRIIKTKLKLEPYLLNGNNQTRSVVFSLRSGTNRLRIETGRWKNEKEAERICKNCENGEIENEIHFVTTCEFVGDLRDSFYRKVLHLTEGRVNLYSDHDKVSIFELVVGGSPGGGEVWNKVCCAAQNFVLLAMRRRNAQAGDCE